MEVQREVNIFLDFENDSDFSSAEIVDGALDETSYSDNNEWDYFQLGELGNCPDCGCTLNYENDGGNGFCLSCALKH